MTEQFEILARAIKGGNLDGGVSESLKLVESGMKPIKIFTGCIEPTLAEIGEQFSRLEIFLPEMINSAEVVKAIQMSSNRSWKPIRKPPQKARLSSPRYPAICMILARISSKPCWR